MTSRKVASKELAAHAEPHGPKKLTPAERKARDDKRTSLGVKPMKVNSCIGIVGVPWHKVRRLN